MFCFDSSCLRGDDDIEEDEPLWVYHSSDGEEEEEETDSDAFVRTLLDSRCDSFPAELFAFAREPLWGQQATDDIQRCIISADDPGIGIKKVEKAIRKAVQWQTLLRVSKRVDPVPEARTFGRAIAFDPTPIYGTTHVSVVAEDCLVVARSLHESGHRPAILNMASERHPGGLYLEGANAQEEDIMRRSNYAWVMDPGLFRRSGPLHCTEDLPPALEYPLGSMSVVYASPVTVFRGPASVGYPLYPEPFPVGVIAAPAVMNPPCEADGRVCAPVAETLRERLRLLFNVAKRHDHDALVLSAWGCGKFGCPPEHMAQIMRAVCLEHHGYFRRIVFAILPSGSENVCVFKRALYGFHYPELRPMPFQDTQTTKYLGAMCPEGGLCLLHGRDEAHDREYSHPRRCPLGEDCRDLTVHWHRRLFVHESEAAIMRSPKTHSVPLWEPPAATPLSMLGLPRPLCVMGDRCTRYMEVQHMEEYRHPYKGICSDAGMCPLVLQGDRTHIEDYTHVCRYGVACRHRETHCRHNIHKELPICANGPDCDVMDSAHRESMQHPGHPCVLIPCREGVDCRLYRLYRDEARVDAKVRQHLTKYGHYGD